MKKKLLLLLLALCLALSVPVAAVRAEETESFRLTGVTATADGALLATDVYNKVVWRIDGEKATRFAGVIGVEGLSGEPTGAYLDAAVDKAYFVEPWDIVPFLNGYAVSDAGANALRYVADGRVYTLAGTNGKAGSADGDAKSATFERPTGLAVDSDGALYVADAVAGTVRRVDKSGKVTTLASGLAEPMALCWSDGTLYVVESGRHRVCRIVNGEAQPYAGVSTAAADADEYYGGYVDGPLASAKFDHPQGIAAGADGTLYVADTSNSAIRMIRDGRVYTLARADDVNLRPTAPCGLLVSGDTLYVTDRAMNDMMSYSLAAKRYSDVAAGAWYAAAVESATRNGIASGVSETEFAPDGSMNRAMFVTMLSRLHRLGDGTVLIKGKAGFADVPADEWYAGAVSWAADREIVLGEGEGFAPLRSISRQELVTMLYRYAQKQGLNAALSEDALAAYPDASDTASWALAAMRWACTQGILRGDDEGRLNPAASATRAQALTMLLNFMNAYSM